MEEPIKGVRKELDVATINADLLVTLLFIAIGGFIEMGLTPL
jgi:hypothetical protein